MDWKKTDIVRIFQEASPNKAQEAWPPAGISNQDGCNSAENERSSFQQMYIKKEPADEKPWNNQKTCINESMFVRPVKSEKDCCPIKSEKDDIPMNVGSTSIQFGQETKCPMTDMEKHHISSNLHLEHVTSIIKTENNEFELVQKLVEKSSPDSDLKKAFLPQTLPFLDHVKETKEYINDISKSVLNEGINSQDMGVCESEDKEQLMTTLEEVEQETIQKTSKRGQIYISDFFACSSNMLQN